MQQKLDIVPLLSEDERNRTYSKRTIYHHICWLTGSVVLLLSVFVALYIYSFHGDSLKDEELIQIYFAIFTVRSIAFLAIPIFLYPTRYFKVNHYPLFDFDDDEPTYLTSLSICTYAITCVLSMEIIYFIYFNCNFECIDNWDLKYVINICEGICILYQIYLVIYRFITKREDFFLALFGDEIKTQKPEFIEYRELLYPDKYTKNCCYKIRYFIQKYILSNLWFLFQLLNVVLFFIFVGILILIAAIYTFIDLYIVSIILICCCNERRKRKLLHIKRMSHLMDYLLFYVILNEFNMDTVFAYFIQNEPFKELLISVILIFFQHRYFSQFLKDNSLPNYDLLNNEYTTFRVLTEYGKTTYTRWLPSPKVLITELPDPESLAKTLFLRNEFIPETNMRLSYLAACYIRYFTHQFTNTHSKEWNKVNQPIGINMSQLYDDTPRLGKDGLFKSVMINNEEFPLIDEDNKIFMTSQNTPNRPQSPDYFMIHILFFRNHQYIARSLKNEYDSFDDDRIYETTKMINILILIKITLSLYGDVGIVQSTVPSTFTVDNLEHLFKSKFNRLFGAVGSLFPSNSSNIPIEFNILYRWHQLVPPKIELTRYNDEDSKQDDDLTELTLPFPTAVDFLTERNNLETLLLASSKTNVGKLSLNNTEPFLVNMAVIPTIKKTRYYNLASFNDYRERFGFKRYSSMDELTSNKDIANKLNELYDNNVDNVEFYVGIFAEDKIGNALHGSFLTAIFASTVITLLTSSPLLRKDWNKMLTPLGRQIVNDVNLLNDLVDLHTKLLKRDVSTRVNE